MHAPLICISSMATRDVLAALAARMTASGERTDLQAMGGVDAAKRVRAGARIDVVVLAASVMGDLEREGFVIAGSVRAIARSGIAVAVKAGAVAPDIRSADAVKRAMLAARRPCYSTGPSGTHLRKLWAEWGIAETMEGRALQAPPGVPVARLLAQGEADLGFQQMSELVHAEGVTVVGALPPDIQSVTTFSAGIAATCDRIAEAGAFIAALAAPDSAEVKERHGMLTA